MVDNKLNIAGSGGGGKGGGTPSTPTEAKNSLYNTSIARYIDFLGAGEIEGVVGNNKGIYLNDVPLQAADGSYNFTGVYNYFRNGTAAQTYIPWFEAGAPSANNVAVQLTYNVPVSRTITDSDVDHATVTVSTPTLQIVDSETGDISATSVYIYVYVNDLYAGCIDITGKCTSTYQKTFEIDDLTTYGAAPWVIKLVRQTADSASSYLQNTTHWVSYDEYIDGRFNYPYSAMVGTTIDSALFGINIPTRAYLVKGLLIQVPVNRTQSTRTYTGVWNGSFKTEWADNPAWVLYGLLTNSIWGMGLPASMVDTAKLYTIGVYNDGFVPYWDNNVEKSEARYTFNYAFYQRKDAFETIKAVCSAMNVQPYWAGGILTFTQDCPTSATRAFNQSNVLEEGFNYESSALKARHTRAYITWYDPEDMYRPAVALVEDGDGIIDYGVRDVHLTAVGCTSRGQAIRKGKWILDSEKGETDVVKFTAGMDASDLMPGEVIKVYDVHYTAKRWGGRIKTATTTQIVMDTTLTFVGGNTYHLDVYTPSGVLMADKSITNPATTTDTINLPAALDEAPQVGSVFAITSDDVEEPRQFRVINVTETDKHQYTVTSLYYDSTKFARIEQGVYIDEPPYSNIPEGVLTPPSTIQCSERAYTEGGLKNHKFAVDIGWVASSDIRTEYYEVEKATISGTYALIGQTSGIYLEDKPVEAGTYWYRVRGRSAAAASSYISTEMNVYATTSGLPDITGLQVLGGGYEFTGKDCEIIWSPTSSTVSGVLKDYKVVVRKGDDDTLLRTDYVMEPTYIYSFVMNTDDNSGSPIRNPKFQIYGRDIYEGLSQTPAAHVMTNPAPSMSGNTPTVTAIFKGLKIDWSNITPADTDLSKYIVYCDENASPTTEIAEVSTDTTYWVEPGLSTSGTYYVQIEPWDGFGVGTKSNVTGGTEPIPVNVVDIDGELSESIVMSDSDGNSADTLARLYDRNITSSGISYTVSGTDSWINYNFGLEEFIDRVSIYTADANAQIYIGYKRKDGSWSYLKAEADHTLDADGELIAASNQADGQTNYWQLSAGKNVAIFPQRIIADECRLYLTSGVYTTEIYELIFMREVIAEQVTADNLSAISADVGTITAGTIQSADLSATEGVLIDLDSNDLKIGGTTDPKFFWDNSADTLYIDGKIDASRELSIQEGGRLVVGDDNVVADSTNNSLWVAPNGGKVGNNYIELKDGELDSYYWDGSNHLHYKSVTRIESGVADNNTSVTIPGIFMNQPFVMISPNYMKSYKSAYASQSQSIHFEVLNLKETTYGNKEWKFTPRAALELSSGSTGAAVNQTNYNYSATLNDWDTFTHDTSVALAPNTRTISVTFSVSGYTGDSYRYLHSGSGETVVYKWRRKYYAEYILARVYYLINGAWSYIDQAVGGIKSDPGRTYTVTLNVPTQSVDITYFCCYLVHNGKNSDYLPQGTWASDPGDVTYQVLKVDSYTSNQIGTSAIANGTLNWVAVGN